MQQDQNLNPGQFPDAWHPMADKIRRWHTMARLLAIFSSIHEKSQLKIELHYVAFSQSAFRKITGRYKLS
jgi:hypothetical protein